MEPKVFGLRIAKLRKEAKMTQSELADKLNISNKAVSKWEVGGGLPDLQQITGLCKVFNITYNQLLGEEELIFSAAPTNLADPITPKPLSIDEWYSLDNAAKVYPTEFGGTGNSIFRISAVLKENVDCNILERALQDSIGRFPTIMVTIKKGLFWYYFEPITHKPQAEVDSKFPMQAFKLDGRRYLFRIVYFGNRVSLEVFHSITDGTGAMIFFNSILARYYQLKCGKIEEFINCKNLADMPLETETEDSFIRYSGKQSKASGGRDIMTAYHLTGKRTLKGRTDIIHLVMQGDKLNTYAKSLGATVTEFLTAVIIQATINRQKYDKKLKNPIVVQVPINLRKIFPSDTLRNFAFFANILIKSNSQEYTFEDILIAVKTQMKDGVDREFLESSITANVRDEQNPVLRVVPIGVKKIGLNIVKLLLGDRNTTIGFSNLGVQKAPKELEKLIDRYEFVLKPAISGGIALSCVTYNNRCVLTVARTIKERYFEKAIAKELVDRGIALVVEGNCGGSYENL